MFTIRLGASLSSVATITLAASFMHTNSAVAQESGAVALEEITVTAQRRSENLQKVPIAVTALTSSELAGANIDGQLALPKLTPNLNFNVTSTLAAAYIRGIGTAYALPGLESSVAAYFDDTYLPRSTSALFSFGDIERIEVLKGPQGTLYGRNASGGAIRIITKSPQPVFESSLSALYGSQNRVAVDGMINVPLSDTVAARVAIRHDQNDGYVRNIDPGANGQKFNKSETLVTGKLQITPNDHLSIKFSGDYSSKRDRDGAVFLNLYPGAPQQTGAAFGGCAGTNFYNGCSDPRARTKVDTYGASGRIDRDIGPAALSSITGYRSIDENVCADIDATGINLLYSCGKPYTRQFTQEFLVTSNGSSPLRYVAGLFYLNEKSEYPLSTSGLGIDGFSSQFGINITGSTWFGNGDVRTHSLAPFAQIDWDFAERWSATIGARYTWEKKTLLGNAGGYALAGADGFPQDGTQMVAPFGPCSALNGGFLCGEGQRSIKSNQFTPKFTLSFKSSDEALLYVTVARGFKSGGFNLPSASFGAVDEVRPETLDDVELGWKYQSGPVRFNGSAFAYNYKDLQVQFVGANGGSRLENAASAKLYGVEADLAWALNEGFELGAGAGYLHSKYQKFIGGAFADNVASAACAAAIATPSPADDVACVGLSQLGNQDLSGKRLTNAPRYTGYLKGQYTHPLRNNGKLQLSAILNFRSEAYFDAANLFADKQRSLLSAKASWSTTNDRFQVSLIGENLTGKEYDGIKSPQSTGGFRTPAPPRQIFLQAGVKF